MDHLVVIDLLKHCYGLIYFRDSFQDFLKKVDKLMKDKDLNGAQGEHQQEAVIQEDAITRGLDNYK